MKIIYGALTDEEFEKLLEGVEYNLKKNGSPAIKKFLNIDKAKQSLLYWGQEGYLIKYYDDKIGFCGILAFELCQPWWSDVIYLGELTMLSVKGANGLQREVCKTLDFLAEHFKAQYISTGCYFANNPQLVTNGYKKQGYTCVNTSYEKIIERDD